MENINVLIDNLLADQKFCKDLAKAFELNEVTLSRSYEKDFVIETKLTNLIKASIKNKVIQLLLPDILFLIDKNSFSDSVIELCLNYPNRFKKTIEMVLGHLDLADKWLFILASEVPEALQTLIVRYYTKGTENYHSNNATYEQFVEFIMQIQEYKFFKEMLQETVYVDWLKNLKSDNEQKQIYLMNYINQSN